MDGAALPPGQPSVSQNLIRFPVTQQAQQSKNFQVSSKSINTFSSVQKNIELGGTDTTAVAPSQEKATLEEAKHRPGVKQSTSGKQASTRHTNIPLCHKQNSIKSS